MQSAITSIPTPGGLIDKLTTRLHHTPDPNQVPEDATAQSRFSTELSSALIKCQLAQMDAVHECPLDRVLPPRLSAKIEKTSSDMEAMFIGQLLKSMWKTIPEGEFSMKGTAGEIYRDIFIDQVSKMASQGVGIGLKQVIQNEIEEKERAKYVGSLLNS